MLCRGLSHSPTIRKKSVAAWNPYARLCWHAHYTVVAIGRGSERASSKNIGKTYEACLRGMPAVCSRLEIDLAEE